MLLVPVLELFSLAFWPAQVHHEPHRRVIRHPSWDPQPPVCTLWTPLSILFSMLSSLAPIIWQKKKKPSLFSSQLPSNSSPA